MRGRLWLQTLAISLLISLIFCIVGYTFWRGISLRAIGEVRASVYLFVVRILESAPYPESMPVLENFLSESPLLANHIWVISDDGAVLATNSTLPLPPEWRHIARPQQPHAIEILLPSGGYIPSLTMVRLHDQNPTFAVIRSTPNTGMIVIQFALFIFILIVSISGGLATTFFYLRRTSREAKRVMSRLEAGDLEARFPIEKFDEISSLKLDFNKMADQIQVLVERVQHLDRTRANLLQELSHDLRTPLTSLRTSVETLTSYRDAMNPEQQREILNVIQGELNYFVRLLDDLFFVADIAEPNYRGTLETADISELLCTEIRARNASDTDIVWHLECADSVFIQCDTHLLLRLFRNTFDNAARYARHRVSIVVEQRADNVVIRVSDDGSGMTTEALAGFGKRRKHRRRESSASSDVSLGLGSVIIQTIVSLHQGEMIIQSSAVDSLQPQGTTFIFTLPRNLRGVGPARPGSSATQ